MIKLVKYMLLAILAIIVSCTAIDICDINENEHPHMSSLAFRFNWEENVTDEEKPDTMIVIANRIINSWRTGFAVNTDLDTYVYTGHTLFNNSEANTLLKDTTMRVRGGDYQFIALNKNFNECTIDSLTEFQTDMTVKANDLYISYKTYERLDSIINRFNHAWSDFNSYGKFTVSAMDPIYYTMIPKQTIQTGDTVFIDFHLHEATQRITINFNIEKERGVSVDTIIGIMAGIPNRIGLTTKYVDIEHTSKTIFVPQTDYLNNNNSTTINCSGTINAIGLLRARNNTYKQGPGILQLCIFTKTLNESTKLMKSKTVYAIINLYNTIGEAKPLIRASDGIHYVQNDSKEIVLNIANVLKIEKGEVVEDSNDKNTLDTWKQTKSFNVDI